MNDRNDREYQSQTRTDGLVPCTNILKLKAGGQ